MISTHWGLPVPLDGQSVRMGRTCFIHSSGALDGPLASGIRKDAALKGTTGPVEISKPRELSVLGQVRTACTSSKSCSQTGMDISLFSLAGSSTAFIATSRHRRLARSLAALLWDTKT